MAGKILTLHPEGRQGVNIDKDKYELIKSTILKVLEDGPKRFNEIVKVVSAEMEHFPGSISWYVVTVKLDLEARGIIVRKPDNRGHTVSIKH